IELRVDDRTGLARHDLRTIPNGGSSWHDLSSPVWGIDRASQSPTLKQEDYDRELEQYLAEIARWRNSTRQEFIGFNASAPLHHWAQLDGDAFTDFAQRFLQALQGSDVRTRLDFSFFASCVAISLLRLKPKLACQPNDSGRFPYAAEV